MSISKILCHFICVFSLIKDAPGWDLGVLGGQNLSVGICDGAPSTARSSFIIVSLNDKHDSQELVKINHFSHGEHLASKILLIKCLNLL